MLRLLAVLLLLQACGASSSSEKPRVTVLLWDKTAGYLNWGFEWFRKAAETKCSTRCVVSEDKGIVQTADMVLFHAPTHVSVPGGNSKRAGAVYAMLSMEQPKYARFLSDLQYLKRHFDLLATYSQADFYPGTSVPNLPLSYFPLNILTPASVLQPARPFASKTGLDSGVSVAIFTSNCHAAGASQRYQYIEELSKLIKVHSYGKCHKNADEPSMPEDPQWPAPAQRRARKVKVLSHYKFYLAFENLAVDDYVSEKVFEGLFAGAVPVYRGAKQISQFMPGNDSFINANDMSPAQLAELLLRLKDDEDAYGHYMTFKNRPLPASFNEVALRSYTHPNVLCRLCAFALEHRGK